jgi:FAD/FMN-containing dehydrogenase
MSTADMIDLSLDGQLASPGSPDYDAVRKPAISRFHGVRPRAVARCLTEADVARTLGFARRHELPLAVRGGGHSFAGYSSSTGVVIDLAPMDSIQASVPPGGGARVDGGVRLGGLYAALAEHGRTVAAGCGATVGVAGLTLGGGLGLLGRRHGLTCDQLVSARVVLADGSVVECDERRDSGLFWALRGGGSWVPGVVTAMSLRTVPAPDVTAFQLAWDWQQAAAVILAWQDWSPLGPADLAASLVVTAGGDHPGVQVFGTVAGHRPAAARLLSALIAQAGAYPRRAFTARLPYLAAKRQLGGESRPDAWFVKSGFFGRPLRAETIHALVTDMYRDRSPGEYRELDFSPWAGAYNQVPSGATAFPHRDALFLLKHATSTARTGWLTRSWRLVHPSATGGVYPNFPDPGLGAKERYAYYGANLPRLRAVHAAYDPDGTFDHWTART